MEFLTALKAVCAFVRRYWKEAVMLLLLLLAYLKGWHDTDAKWQIKWKAQEAVQARALFNASEQARKREQEWVAAFDAAATISNEEMKNVQDHRDRLLADLRAGRLRLQACPAARLPEAPADSGQPATAETGGQSAMAGELVNRLAVCDEVTLERNQAVRLLEAERQ